MTQPMEAREALQDYLRSKAPGLVRPTLVKSGSSKGDGAIKTNFEDGTILLRRAGKRYLVLFADRKGPPPRVEPGKYELLGYRVERSGKDGVGWFVSTTGPKGSNVIVSEGLPTLIKVDPVLRVDLRTMRKKGAINVRVGIQDWRKAPVTIYKDGERIPIPYEIRDGSSRIVASGNLKYG